MPLVKSREFSDPPPSYPLDYIITWSSHAKRATCLAMLWSPNSYILRLSTYKFIIFVFQLINFHYRSHFLRNVIPYFWYSHIIRTFKGLCLRSHELENSLVSSPWFSVYLWNQWFSCTWSLPFRIFHVWISSPLCLRSSRLVILTSFNFSSYEPP